MAERDDPHVRAPAAPLSNADIADRLASLAQLLSTQKANPYKVRAYQRAASQVRTLAENIPALVRDGADLTQFAGIGKAISSAIREIVLTGTLVTLDELRAQAGPALADLSQYPRLDPRRILRVYKTLDISSIAALRQQLESGEIDRQFGQRMAQHVRQGLTETRAMLLYKADALCATVREFLIAHCGVRRAEVVGAYRRRVDVIEELAFVIETADFPAAVARMEGYGGGTPMVHASKSAALFTMSAGILLRLEAATTNDWGLSLIAGTGSETHLRKLTRVTGRLTSLKGKGPFLTETDVYRRFSLPFIAPELREGHDEVARAVRGDLPVLVSAHDIRGELHAHSTSSDGSGSIEEMALAAQARGYEYIGITDHSRSLKIAHGLSVEDLLEQIRAIDRLNARLTSIRILKSAEVDILADGSLDYPDDVLRELDYTVCSIHSRFGLGPIAQTERILRAMDHRGFTILGHATGRLLLKRPGYEIDIDRVIAHARASGCFFEINSSPDRLDLSADHARAAAIAGVRMAVSTDAHSTRELDFVRCGIDQARRAGLETSSVLNTLPWQTLAPLLRR